MDGAVAVGGGGVAREARGVATPAAAARPQWGRVPDALRRLRRWLTYRPERRYMRRRDAA